MRARLTIAVASVSTALLAALSSETASAQTRYRDHREPRYRAPVRDGDEARMRLGIALEGGGLFAPGLAELGFVGLQGQLGVQFNDVFAVYAAPNVDFATGWRQAGLQVGGAVMADFTILHVFTIGIGPELEGFVVGGGGDLTGGVLFGARMRLALNPLVSIDRRQARREALTIGLDLRLVSGGAAGQLSGRGAGAADLVGGPTLFIGYQAF